MCRHMARALYPIPLCQATQDLLELAPREVYHAPTVTS